MELSEERKEEIANADHIFIPVVRKNNRPDTKGKTKQEIEKEETEWEENASVYLVHIKP